MNLRRLDSNLIGVMLDAPIQAVRARWPSVIHAVTLDDVAAGWQRKTYRTACGINGVRLLGLRIEDRNVAAPWPPRVASLIDQKRCRQCWIATGKKRPRMSWVREDT